MRGCAVPNRTRAVWQQIFSRPFRGLFLSHGLRRGLHSFAASRQLLGGNLFLT
jgi:hypothetical protein